MDDQKFRSIYFFLLVIAVPLSFAYVCTPNYCNVNPCVVDVNCQSKNNSRTVVDGGTCGCCDLCILQLGLDEPCNPVLVAIPSSECGAGLTCDADLGKCVLRSASQCTYETIQYDDLRNNGSIVPGTLRPKCDYYGYYDSVRCIAGSVCFCVDKEGQRIFGTDFVGRQDQMLCNCSRGANSLGKILANTAAFTYGSVNYTAAPPFAHCLPNGNYDPLQCVSGNCFCLSKDLKLDSDISSESIKETLVCYEPRYHQENYIRGCEKVRDEILLSKSNMSRYNADVYGVDIPLCDLDGSYAAVQCVEDMCYCAEKYNGTKMGNYNATRYSDDARKMTCYCARDRTHVSDPMLRDQYECDSKGDYMPMQCQGSLCYCVNQYGIQEGAEVQFRDKDQLNCTPF